MRFAWVKLFLISMILWEKGLENLENVLASNENLPYARRRPASLPWYAALI
ncbi:hypothetical protein FHS14_000685 [Paenibacillus baekrokdamisoli]|nr:hypothetical protein [Paenibacillus baekrokdamisoli]